jgi:hypothetical protein
MGNKCFECGKPMVNVGYCCGACAKIAHARHRSVVDAKYPFIVMGGDGQEVDRFATEQEAEDYLDVIRRAYIRKV